MVTNHGGGSAVSIFLPRGAAAIVFWHGNFIYDHHWYESAGYIRPVWVGVAERKWTNHTMSLIDNQVVKASIEWNNRFPGGEMIIKSKSQVF